MTAQAKGCIQGTIRVLVFCKAPEPGKVKTRLMSEFTAEEAAQIHEALATETLEQVLLLSQTKPELSVELWCAPSTEHSFFQHYQRRGVLLHDQVGSDLGLRMHHGIAQSATPAILIGTDCPPVDADYVLAAVQELQKHDAVIGPAEDGGYGLIGLKQPNMKLFSDIEWSTSRVLDETLSRCGAQGLETAVLPTIWDVDFPNDVKRWRELSLHNSSIN
jgi:uncharacterized protein